MSEEIEWEVEEILQRGKHNNMTHYLVKWKGYPKEEATWEPITHLDHCQEQIMRFQQSIKTCKPSRKTTRKPRSKRMSLQKVYHDESIKVEGLCSIQNENVIDGHKDQEETKQIELKKKFVPQVCQKQISKVQNQNIDQEVLQIVSPNIGINIPQNKDLEVKSIITNEIILNASQNNAKNKLDRKSLIKRFFSRIYKEDPMTLPKKKIKLEESVNVQVSKSDPTKDNVADSKHSEQIKPKASNFQQIYQNTVETYKNESQPQQSENQKKQENQENCDIQALYSQSEEKNQTTSTKTVSVKVCQIQNAVILPKIQIKQTKKDINSFLNDRQIICDRLLKEINKSLLKAVFIKQEENIRKRAPVFDLTWFPDVLDELENLNILTQPDIDMQEIEALIRLNYGWVVIGKSEGVTSIVPVKYLKESTWNKMLQKYK